MHCGHKKVELSTWIHPNLTPHQVSSITAGHHNTTIIQQYYHDGIKHEWQKLHCVFIKTSEKPKHTSLVCVMIIVFDINSLYVLLVSSDHDCNPNRQSSPDDDIIYLSLVSASVGNVFISLSWVNWERNKFGHLI